jgi:putative DNA primase/helicase
LEQEREQIFKWALIGLRRVMANGWKITWSERSRTYMKLNKSNAVHFEDFFNETCEVATNEDTTIAEIKKLYSKWCTENGVKEASERRLSTWFADNAEKIGIQRSVHIKRNGKDLRGYVSLKIKPEWKNLTIVL